MGVVTKATEKEDEQVNFTKTLALLASYNWAPAPSCPKYGPHTSSISSLFWNFSEKQNFKPLPQRLTRVHLLPQNLHFNKISRWFLCTLMFEMVQFSSLLWFKNEKKKKSAGLSLTFSCFVFSKTLLNLYPNQLGQFYFYKPTLTAFPFLIQSMLQTSSAYSINSLNSYNQQTF